MKMTKKDKDAKKSGGGGDGCVMSACPDTRRQYVSFIVRVYISWLLPISSATKKAGLLVKIST